MLRKWDGPFLIYLFILWKSSGMDDVLITLRIFKRKNKTKQKLILTTKWLSWMIGHPWSWVQFQAKSLSWISMESEFLPLSNILVGVLLWINENKLHTASSFENKIKDFLWRRSNPVLEPNQEVIKH